MPTVRRRFKTPTSFSFLPKRSGRVRTGEATAYDPVRQGKMAEGRRRRFDVGKTKYLAGKQTQMQKRSLASAAQRQEKRLREANDFLRSIRRGIIRTWEHNDLLREQLVGSHKMPDGRMFREHTRDEFLRLSFEYTSTQGVTEGSDGEESP